MSDIVESLRQRVKAIMPELEIQHFEINQEELINDVAIVNNKLFFDLQIQRNTQKYMMTR
jgi:hypothetical protein